MNVRERAVSVRVSRTETDIIDAFAIAFRQYLGPDESLLRFVATDSAGDEYRCELTVLSGAFRAGFSVPDCLQLVKRPFEDTSSFNAVLVVPTGIGSAIGGHAGDAGPVAKLLGSVCDKLVTHPNVVNASDINEAPENCLYVEGSVLSRLLLGSVALEQVRQNRVLVVIDKHCDPYFTNAAVNAVGAARAAYGLFCPKVAILDPGILLKAEYSSARRAVGEVWNIDGLLGLLAETRNEYDSVAISSVIDVPQEYHQHYFDAAGEMVNPWGGVEAILTHTVSMVLNVPSAHSPMFENRDVADVDPGIVEPRMSAEAVSFTFIQSILKGLQRSPRIVCGQALGQRGLIDVTNISCLVIPDGCLGIPTIAALAQGIPVIAVRENTNLMRNDLERLPWKEGQFQIADNYLEAAGMLAAFKAGIAPASVRRPLPYTRTLLIRNQNSDSIKARYLASSTAGSGSSPT